MTWSHVRGGGVLTTTTLSIVTTIVIYIRLPTDAQGLLAHLV